MSVGDAVVLVPRRSDGGHRDRLWEWVRGRLDLPVVEGHHEAHEGAFNRSSAINRAARAAGDWKVAVIVDADTFTPGPQIVEAVRLARDTGQIAWGFTRYAALDREGTRKVMDGFNGSWEPHVLHEFLHTASSCVVVRRDLWDAVGGFDEGFVGWGFEDVAFSLACQAVGGGWHRAEGTTWHLWHPPSPDAGNTNSPIWRANRDRCQPYIDAGFDPARMRAVLHDMGVIAR